MVDMVENVNYNVVLKFRSKELDKETMKEVCDSIVENLEYLMLEEKEEVGEVDCDWSRLFKVEENGQIWFIADKDKENAVRKIRELKGMEIENGR